MKIVLIIVAAVVAAVIVILAVGAMLPRKHRVSREVVLRRPPEQVFATITDFASMPRWRSDVTKVELLPNGFREIGSNGAVTYDVVERDAPRRLVTRIADTNLGYGGTWTYELTPENGGTRLRITEDGDVSNIFFRFMSRFVFGHASTIERYLAALERA